MPFSFECGTCRALYRLDDDQITAGGVKVTCPRCMSFFYFKRGAGQEERPLVEHIISDGPHEIPIPGPQEGEMTTDQLLSEEDVDLPHLADAPPQKIPTPKAPARPTPPKPIEAKSPGRYSYTPKAIPERPKAPIAPNPSIRVTEEALKSEGESQSPVKIPPSLREVTGSRRLTRQIVDRGPARVQHGELIELPSDDHVVGKFEKLLVPVSAGIIVVGLLVLLNVIGVYRIPYLQKPKIEATTDKPAKVREQDPNQPKYGFPEVETRDAK